MEIDGVEHGLILLVTDEDGNTVVEENYPGLEELNERLDEIWEDDRSFEWEASLSFVEIADGAYGPRSAEHPLCGFVPLDEWELEELISDELEIRAEFKELFSAGAEHARIEYRGRTGGPSRKEERIEEIAYVCPNCLEELCDCACSFYPYYLIQIDRGMLPIIRTLNQKGYVTSSCCAGHVWNKSNIHVQFAEPYAFASKIPEGAIYWKRDRAVDFGLLEQPSDEDCLAHQRRALAALLEWAESLPPMQSCVG